MENSAFLKSYAETRKQKIDPFLDDHFSLRECFELQKKHLLTDLFVNPLNALWAIPYLSIKKVLETLDQLGWEPAKSILKKVPSTFKTRYQLEIERLVETEVLSLPEDRSMTKEMKAAFQQEAQQELANYGSKQASISDLASSAATYFVASRMFGDSSLNSFGMGRKVASIWAKDEAASNFFLGESIGQAFYSIAPPEPTTWQIVLSTFIILMAVALLSTTVAVVSLPLQRKLGFQKRSIEKLIEGVTDRWIIKTAKEFSSAKDKAA